MPRAVTLMLDAADDADADMPLLLSDYAMSAAAII